MRPFSFVLAATSGVVAKALDGRSARGLLFAWLPGGVPRPGDRAGRRWAGPLLIDPAPRAVAQPALTRS
jgi:hypothetical protein